ncbi:hypothetical protein [Providencia sp. Me31A]|uniref:hypothetical protein n=1 Tax=Providencia sp. Me31A TaxID=3392637 RepID=UPI003D26B93C
MKSELTEMIRVEVPQEYKPSYPRFIMDWPDETGLISALIDADYKKIRKKSKIAYLEARRSSNLLASSFLRAAKFTL